MAEDFEIEIDSNFNKNYNSIDNIETINNDIAYKHFFSEYLITNTPVIIKDISNNWGSMKHWVNNHTDKINFPYLHKKYGKSPIIVYNCNIPHYNSQKTECSILSEYLDNWDKAEKDLLYLKDWHLKNQYPEDQFYKVPIYFASDWLNEYHVECLTDDYRFVYIGPKNTWTPFHADVFTSFSWSTNIFGQKKWLLFPPGEESKLKDDLGNLPYDISKCDINNCKYFEVTQKAGEALFVPSGWFHQVWNLKHSISINHNWVNGCNIKTMWTSLSDYLVKVENEIDDCKDMEGFEEHCQVMLKASHGIDFKGFYEMLRHISRKRIQFLRNGVSVNLFDCYRMGRNHCVFDLERIYEVLEIFIKNKNAILISEKDEHFRPEELMKDIEFCIIK